MFLEEIKTERVIGTVEDVRDFDTKDGVPSMEVRVLDPKAGRMFRLSMTHAECVEQGLVPEQVMAGMACRVLAEVVTITNGPKAGLSFMSVKKLQFGKPGERLRTAGQEAVEAEAGTYASVGARLDAKLNGAPASGAVVVVDGESPF